MPKASKSAQCTVEPVPPEECSDQEETSFEQEVEQEVTLNPLQAYPNMYMRYIEGPSIDWTVNDIFYNRFLKWKLKCENILECELAMLSETRKCKKVIAW